MTEIRKAAETDLLTIHEMAQVVFRHTYREILSPEQMEYMMDMMYSLPNLRKQLEEGHHYYIAYGPANQYTVCENHLSGNQVVGAEPVVLMPCGYVSVQYVGPDPDGVEVFHLHKIYVMPDAQGRGVGMKLFQAVVQHVKAALRIATDGEDTTAIGISETSITSVETTKARIELNVNKFNAAVNFYKHLGMKVLLEEDFPIGNGFYKTDYIMGLDL